MNLENQPLTFALLMAVMLFFGVAAIIVGIFTNHMNLAVSSVMFGFAACNFMTVIFVKLSLKLAKFKAHLTRSV
jgi:hypothetical protein